MLATSTNPTGGTAAWTLSRFDLGANRVHCASSTLCFASENYTDRFYTSSAPGGGAATFDRGALGGGVRRAPAPPSASGPTARSAPRFLRRTHLPVA